MEKLVNRDNYLLIKDYLASLSEARQLSPASIERYRFYLRHLLLWANEIPLTQAHTIKPTLFVYLDEIETAPGKSLAGETSKKIVELARKFFEWCKMERATAFRSLPTSWINKLKFQKKSAARAKDDAEFVSLDEAITLSILPGDPADLAHWRDRAMAARLFLTGERASAAVTSPISAINFEERSLKQWPELGVQTKNSKKATTYLLDIPALLEVARSWDEFVRANLPPTAPWYAPINSQWGEQTLSDAAPGENRNIALNKRLRLLFDQAGLPFRSAHKFRHGHAAYGLLHCQTMADYKALSLNLMHESLEITDAIYVHVQQEEQRSRIAKMTARSVSVPDQELQQYLMRLSKQAKLDTITALAKALAE